MSVMPSLLLALSAGCTPSDQSVNEFGDRVQDPDELDSDIKSVTEHKLQTASSDVDFLLVIDDSGSMEDEQANIIENFHNVFRFFEESQTNYHIGVITTDGSKRGKLQNYLDFFYITPNTDNELASMGLPLSAEDVFVNIASVGASGSGQEKGLQTTHLALTDHQDVGETNDGFLRPEAALHVTVVSDERDQSVGNWELTLSDEMTDLKASKTFFFKNGRYPTELELEIIRLSPDYQVDVAESEDLVQFHSIIGLEESTCAGVSRGEGYEEVTDLVGGKKFDICSEDWSPMISELGVEAAQALKREFFLSDVPVVDTIRVTVEYEDEETLEPVEYNFIASDDPATAGAELFYNRSRNSVFFKQAVDVPPLGASVSLEYDTLVSSH